MAFFAGPAESCFCSTARISPPRKCSLGVSARSPSLALGHLGRSHKLHAAQIKPRHPQKKAKMEE